jgi:diguanylate cyclase (GGDEF)-like protein/PAS domain S-box-containing protein
VTLASQKPPQKHGPHSSPAPSPAPSATIDFARASAGAPRRHIALDESSTALARKALVIATLLALTGSVMGLYAITRGVIIGAERIPVVSCCVFSSVALIALAVFRGIGLQLIASVSTAYYTLYLLAQIVLTVHVNPQSTNLIVYLFWFFPVLGFNNLVNVPAIGRFFSRAIVVAPIAALAVLLPGIPAYHAPALFFPVMAYCLSFLCFGLMINAVTRYRNAYLAEYNRSESLRVESEVLESISDCFISLDSALHLVYLNEAACIEFEVSPLAVLGGSVPQIAPAFFSHRMMTEMRAAMSNPSATQFEAKHESFDRWYELRCFPKDGGISVYFRNVTDAVVARRQLEAAHEQVREQSALLDKARDAIFVENLDRRILFWNKGAERLFGWSAAEAVGKAAEELFADNLPEIRDAMLRVTSLGEWKGELTKRHKDGRPIVVESRCTLMRGSDGEPQSVMIVNTDITERKTAQASIQRLAFFDTLTGLPNRAQLQERLESTVSAPKFSQRAGALFLIDLDDFKTLNDSSGHDLGDLLLQQIAERLLSVLRNVGFVARLGDDEFVVLLEDMGCDIASRSRAAQQISFALHRALQDPYQLGSYEYQGTSSIGVALFPCQSDSVESLLKRADIAMHHAKAHGRNAICFFDPAMEHSAAARAQLQADLRRALVEKEFELYYQPQVDGSGSVIGAEALLRWRHPRRGLVPPSEFIPLAEQAGLISDLGAWVLKESCVQLAAWAAQPEFAPLSLSVNVSNRQFFDNHFVNLVEKTIRETQIRPHRLRLEITESSAMERVDDTISKMGALRLLGISFSIDDFGTGYSSLSQLKRLPLDELKIDRCFVQDALKGPTDAALIRTIIALGRNLNLTVVAEGVEKEEELLFLKNCGCFVFQGYLFSRAVPLAEFESFVRDTQLAAESVA